MSKDNVNQFIAIMEAPAEIEAAGFDDPSADQVIAHAASHNLSFSEAELKSVINTRICNAESLPRPWGWALARNLGLVRS
ncbi:MAG: hypothetical protein HOB37_10165 [Rhodospirillaceae bacterium]|jgi:hypothetical protein|nr:hypothetical protein [Rhodospirillaceae bacterium]MBT3910554.1 hypothetical protein [Rhodospirillaceae bacterium]MBT5299411.1 hypothetical protein [Rhodospirillaceae bacterium]MBT5513502.1 hypothetical protein [Rhodospirillaceae bacterium]MBT6085995.1 hypothetical protein [Rhodospirillaceae bacterium]